MKKLVQTKTLLALLVITPVTGHTEIIYNELSEIVSMTAPEPRTDAGVSTLNEQVPVCPDGYVLESMMSNSSATCVSSSGDIITTPGDGSAVMNEVRSSESAASACPAGEMVGEMQADGSVFCTH